MLEAEFPLTSPLLASPRHCNFMYRAHLKNGHAKRLSIFAYEVTGQVLSRQQVQQLDEQLEARVAERTQQVGAALHKAEQRS